MMLDLEESDLQMILLALALTARLRPGFDHYCGEIAEKFSRREMYDAFKLANENVSPQVFVPHCSIRGCYDAESIYHNPGFGGPPFST